MTAPETWRAKAIIEAGERLIDALTYDDSGFQGKGGNGGLISRETIRAADELRLAIAAWKRGRR